MKFQQTGSAASEEKSFENFNGRTHWRTDNQQKVITIAHPEHSSGELKIFKKCNNSTKIWYSVTLKQYALYHVVV